MTFGIRPAVLLSVVVQVAFVLGLVWVSRGLLAIRGLSPRPSLEIAVAVVAVALTLPWTAFFLGHAAEGFIPFLWILAGTAAMRGRMEVAGTLIALSMGWKLWGILGLPLLFLSPAWRRSWRGLGVAMAIVAVMYAPFFVFGTVRTFGFTWIVSSQSVLVDLLVGPKETFGWELRALQGALVVGVGSVSVGIAHLRGALMTGVWAAPVTMGGARLLLDPFAHFYQWLPFQTAALVGVVVVISWPGSRLRYLAAAAASLLFLTLPTAALGVVAIAFGWATIWFASRVLGDEPRLPPVTTTV